jgi:hypothetical protein
MVNRFCCKFAAGAHLTPGCGDQAVVVNNEPLKMG